MTQTSDLEQLRFPIGKFRATETINQEQIDQWLAEISQLPAALRQAVDGLLTDEQLDTPYRPGGWTLRQVVHHLADSHMNAYMRFKLAITEDNPAIKPYDEVRWAECGEAKNMATEVSVNLLESLHIRWVAFLRTLSFDQFQRTFLHPEHNKTFKLDMIVGLYAWHGKHHLAHITETIKRNNW